MPSRLWMFCLPAGFLMIMSQAGIVFRDEGYHLLAVDLLLAGKRPYADFFFHHPPLYIIAQAGWTLLVGKAWSTAHFFSALFSIVAALLAARFTWILLADSPWRQAGAFLAAMFVSTNLLVARYGTMAHYSAFAMCLSFAGFFLLTVPDKKGTPRHFLGGVCCGAATMSTLLTAFIIPLIGIRIVLQGKTGRPVGRALFLFALGILLSCAPLILLFMQTPEKVYFEIFQYHLLRRAGSWTDPQILQWDRQILLTWIYSRPGVIVGFLAISGSLFVLLQRGQERKRKPFVLAIFAAIAIAIPAIGTHPTFDYYYTLLIPFVSVIAAVGACSIGERLLQGRNPWVPVLLITALYSFGAFRLAYLHYKSPGSPWQELELIGQTVAEATPQGELLFAPELVYHAAGRLPPPGLENTYATESVPEQFIGSVVWTISLPKLDEKLKSGVFHTVVLWNRDERVQRLNIPSRYDAYQRFDDFTIWTKKSIKP